ncbi:unnamed protein product, partial [Ectocarpus sp. 12 AP-2014]
LLLASKFSFTSTRSVCIGEQNGRKSLRALPWIARTLQGLSLTPANFSQHLLYRCPIRNSAEPTAKERPVVLMV